MVIDNNGFELSHDLGHGQGVGYLKIKAAEGIPSSKRPNAETPPLDALRESTSATSPGTNSSRCHDFSKRTS